ncbi:hypothetical protein ACQVBX_09395 [Dyella sp. KULCS107]|uniref:hypothetical protein n=1 Tax=Dyella sp. KULCS107 TaxID=3422216 RepID=UPI003D6E9A2E
MKEKINAKTAASFCALLAAMGIAAPTVASASEVSSNVQAIRETRANLPQIRESKLLLETTNRSYEKQLLAAAHVDGTVHGDGTVHADVGTKEPKKPAQSFDETA